MKLRTKDGDEVEIRAMPLRRGYAPAVSVVALETSSGDAYLTPRQARRIAAALAKAADEAEGAKK